MRPRRVRARVGAPPSGWRVLLALGVALLATGVVLMHSVGPQTGAPGHGGHLALTSAPMAAHEMPSHEMASHEMASHGASTPVVASTGAVTMADAFSDHRVAGSSAHHGPGGDVCLAVLPGLLGLALLALSRLRRRAVHLLARPRPTRRPALPRAPPRPTALTLTRLCVLRT